MTIYTAKQTMRLPRGGFPRELVLSLTLGGLMALAFLVFPLEVAVVAGLVAWFALVTLIDMRALVLSILVV